jgi:chemotaxis protein CheD
LAEPFTGSFSLVQNVKNKTDFPPPFPEFAQIIRYWDYHNQTITAKILPGEYYVTRHDEIIATVLGSCVSACVRDAGAGIGAMNHFLLPSHAAIDDPDPCDFSSVATRYGNFAMEHMINDV